MSTPTIPGLPPGFEVYRADTDLGGQVRYDVRDAAGHILTVRVDGRWDAPELVNYLYAYARQRATTHRVAAHAVAGPRSRVGSRRRGREGRTRPALALVRGGLA